MIVNDRRSGAKLLPFTDVFIVWTVVLLASDLPEAAWQALAGTAPIWLFWVKVGVLSVMILLGRRSGPFASFSPFCILLLILTAGRKLISTLGLTPGYVAQAKSSELLLRMVQFEGPRLLLAMIMVAALLILGKRRQDFFFAVGDLRRWKIPGVVLGLSIMVLTFLFFHYELPSAAILKALPLMPAALFIGALAAFDEEVRNRASLLPLLCDVAGRKHAILLTAFYFGMGHYFGGVPSGAAGFLIAGGLGWLYATMMLDTKGIFMPWLNHFLTNVPTFIFWALGSVSG